MPHRGFHEARTKVVSTNLRLGIAVAIWALGEQELSNLLLLTSVN